MTWNAGSSATPDDNRLPRSGLVRDSRDMPQRAVEPPFDQFLATAEQVIHDRPEVDPDMIREIFLEVATTLDNGLALDGLDEHDARAVVAGLCADLVTEDPGAAVRERSRRTLDEEGELHDPASVSRSYLIAASMMQI
jgi:hypothetical protein